LNILAPFLRVSSPPVFPVPNVLADIAGKLGGALRLVIRGQARDFILEAASKLTG